MKQTQSFIETIDVKKRNELYANNSSRKSENKTSLRKKSYAKRQSN